MTDRVILRTDRLTLRPFRAPDFDTYAAYYTGPRAAFVGGPVSRAEAFTRFCAMIGHWQMRGFGRFAICRVEDDTLAFGHAGLLQLDTGLPPELTWTLWHGEDEGQGYAREAATAVRDYAFTQLGLPVLTAVVRRDNAASLRVAETLGGVEDATLPTRFGDEVAFRFTPGTTGGAA
ncbi:GNAT family N-acetyltransferase [Roseivivax marinus]|uniref:GNAT family N-acetyltransferase n=1 Tax=Roseivivax marinus TaxID=1379903 RepID=UPI001F03AC52|nr:GNAT family N-acetyltransferase [Roseivivax marinus]UMA65013.1 GNAT family N-acetyltransferase [Roseivivax marinus]